MSPVGLKSNLCRRPVEGLVVKWADIFPSGLRPLGNILVGAYAGKALLFLRLNDPVPLLNCQAPRE